MAAPFPELDMSVTFAPIPIYIPFEHLKTGLGVDKQ
jgi:hypothetical protein